MEKKSHNAELTELERQVAADAADAAIEKLAADKGITPDLALDLVLSEMFRGTPDDVVDGPSFEEAIARVSDRLQGAG